MGLLWFGVWDRGMNPLEGTGSGKSFKSLRRGVSFQDSSLAYSGFMIKFAASLGASQSEDCIIRAAMGTTQLERLPCKEAHASW